MTVSKGTQNEAQAKAVNKELDSIMVHNSSVPGADSTCALAKAHLSGTGLLVSYSIFPPENVPAQELGCLARTTSPTASYNKAELYTQVLIWCASRRLEALRASATKRVNGSTLRLVHILESFRRGLVDGSLYAHTKPRSSGAESTPALAEPIIQNPVNQQRLRIIKVLETRKAYLKRELHDGIKLLRDWEAQTTTTTSLGRVSERSNCSMPNSNAVSKALSLIESTVSESRQIVAELLARDSELAEATAMSVKWMGTYVVRQQISLPITKNAGESYP